MRRVLDALYLGMGWASALTILAIAVLISAQILLNLATRVLGLPLPSTIPSYADFSGFMLAAATFLAMPYTLRSGGHIRVTLLTSRLAPRPRLVAEIAALVLAAGLVGFAGWYMVKLTGQSLRYGDLSPGVVAIPLWIPQALVAFGLWALCLALVDSLIQTIARGAVVVGGGGEEG